MDKGLCIHPKCDKIKDKHHHLCRTHQAMLNLIGMRGHRHTVEEINRIISKGLII